MTDEADEYETQSDPLPPLENVYFLSVEIIRGINLKIADIGGSSDPFVKVIANKQSYETKTVMKNLNPEWNEKTSFVFFEAVKSIRLEVYDWDKNSKHDSIGEVEVDTERFYSQESVGFHGILDLQKVKKGQIEIRISGRFIQPLDLENRIKRMSKQSQQQSIQIRDLSSQLEIVEDTKTKLSEEKRLLNENQNTLRVEITEAEESIIDVKQQMEQRKRDILEWEKKQQSIKQQIES